MPKTLNELFDQFGREAQEAGIQWADEQVSALAMDLLKKHANPLYSAINALGFGAAQAKLTQQVTDTENARKAAETRASTAETALRTEREKTPDMATINQQWEARLAESTTAHQTEVHKLKDQNRTSLVERDQAQLESDLIALKVPKSVAKVLARDADLLPSRAEYDDKGKLSVRQAGQSIPMAPASGQTFTQLLATEIAGRPDVVEILESGGDAGSGVNGGNRPGGGDKAKYDRIRTQAKKEQEGDTPRMSLEERVKSRQ